MPIGALEKLNELREAQGAEQYANPRNAAAGGIRQLDPAQAARRELRFWAYTLLSADGTTGDSHWDNLERLQELGLPVNRRRVRANSVDEIARYYEDVLAARDELPFEADGIVVKVDSLEEQQELGATGHDPRWATAWKFPAVQVTTRLNGISISVGRFGKLTPVADLEPVQVDGVTVEHASLHNQDDIRRKDIRAGDVVILERAGGVIPQVVGPLNGDPDRETKPFEMPRECPACGSPVQHDPDAAAHWCVNERCGSRPLEMLKHFVSKEAFDIEGMGPMICEQLVRRGMVQNPAQVFELTVQQLQSLDRMGRKSAERVHRNIQSAKERPLERVLYSLGIYRLGRHVSGELAAACRSVDEVMEISHEDLISMDGISDKIAASVLNGFGKELTREMIETMRGAGVALEHTTEVEHEMPEQDKPQPFAGKRICVTGTLTMSGMSRNDANRRITDLGGTPATDVNKNTHILVTGEKTVSQSKVAKARKLGVTVWEEGDFLAEMNGEGAPQDQAAVQKEPDPVAPMLF